MVHGSHNTSVNNIQPSRTAVLQTFNGSITEAIHNLPAELGENIYKEHLTLKIKERSSLGFGEGHREIKSASFWEKHEQITKVKACGKCHECGRLDW